MRTRMATWGLATALALTACDGVPGPDPAPPAAPAPAAGPADAPTDLESPIAAAGEVVALATRLDQGEDVTATDFAITLAPFHKARFERWAEEDVERVVSSFQTLRNALVSRYQIQDPICAEDSWVRYSQCEPSYPCVASVQLAELHCLWFVANH